MSAAIPTPADYPHRELFLSHDIDATLKVLLIEAGTDPDALMLDVFRDVIAAQSHLLLAARDSASLALIAAAFRRLVEQMPPGTVH